MSVKAVFKTVAPFLATAAGMAGGPIGTVAASVLTKYAGTDVKPNAIGDAMTQLATTQEGLEKLRQAEAEMQQQATKMGFDHIEKLEELAAADRDSARKLQIANKDWMPAALGLLATVGFLATLAALAFAKIDAGSKDVLLVLLGILGKMVSDVYGFYFGSSASSDTKNSIIDKLATAKG